VTQLGLALAALEADLERARRSLDAGVGLADAHDLVDDILGLLGALHHLVRRYRDIIDATDGRDP